VSGFETIIGQPLPVRLLQTFLRNAALPHALLFTGPAGVGKRMAARAVAMALNCTERGISPGDTCGRCRSCRQIASDHHPDVLLIEPLRDYLRIDQIRKLLVTLSMKPFSAEQRVVIIAEAQAMNPEAGNALLKVLEEPPDNTTLILTALQKSDLLPTIISRCRHIRFNPLSPEDLMVLLRRSPEIAEEFVETAVTLSGGSFTKARQLAMPAWQDRRNWLLRACGLDRRPPDGRLSLALALAFAAQLAQHKEQIQELLAILSTWLRDLMIYPHHPALVINCDHRAILAKVRAGLDDTRLLVMWQAVEKAQKDIAGKANLRLTLDVMVLSMAGHAVH
jgi:DNA polymerase-3 subunit delta'